MKWKADSEIRPDRTVHVWPAPEEKEHVLHGTDCECVPKLIYYEHATQVVHNAFGEPTVESTRK